MCSNASNVRERVAEFYEDERKKVTMRSRL